MQSFIRPLNRRQLLAGSAALTATVFLSNAAGAQTVPPPFAPPAWILQAIPVTDKGVTTTRTFLYHMPPATGSLLPAVIAFHGGGQNATAMSQHWDSVRGLSVVVCPNALVRPGTGLTEWEFARPGATSVPTLDLNFTEAILDWLRLTGRVDMDRVYASGFSSGGNFTWQLTQLNRSVNWFRGYAPVSAVPNTWMTALANPAAAATPKPLAFTMGTADDHWSQVALGVQQPLPPEVVAAWIGRNRTLDPNPPVVYSCGRGAAPYLEARVDPFGVEQLYANDPAISNSAAIVYMTVVNGAHSWPLTGSDPNGRGMVTHDIDWTKRVVSFWNTYAGMGLTTAPAWTQC
jgi:poly(3-hydroxybutyrate) depolymerase